MSRENFRLDHLIVGFCAGGFSSCTILFTRNIIEESVYTLSIFNFLFVSLIFPLKGTLVNKLLLLLMGDIVGWLWNFVFSMLKLAITGVFFDTLYVVLSPFLNLIWVVPFWSISLTVLANSKRKGE
jgi:hypothetical protein